MTGTILDELDVFRRGGIFFAYPGVYENIVALDVNSLFASVMREMPVPVGDPILGKEALRQGIFYARAVRNGEEVLFNNLSDDKSYDQLLFAVGWRTVESPALKETVDMLYTMRQQFRGTPYEKFFKALLCCPYGKSMQRRRPTVPKTVPTERAAEYLRKNSRIIHSYRETPDGQTIFQRYRSENQYSLMHVGLQVVERARKFMKDIIRQLDSSVIYAQIDSVFIPEETFAKHADIVPIGEAIGQFKIEYRATTAEIYGKGNYRLSTGSDVKVRKIGRPCLS